MCLFDFERKVIALFGILAFFLQHLETFLQVAHAAIFCINKQQLFVRRSRRTVNPVNMNPKNIKEVNSKYVPLRKSIIISLAFPYLPLVLISRTSMITQRKCAQGLRMPPLIQNSSPPHNEKPLCLGQGPRTEHT